MEYAITIATIILYVFLAVVVIYYQIKRTRIVKGAKPKIKHDSFLYLFSGVGYTFIAFSDLGVARIGNLLIRKFYDYPISIISESKYDCIHEMRLETKRKVDNIFTIYTKDINNLIRKYFMAIRKIN
jgi:hypothetical protein